jgi:hypothetical protein
VAPSGAVTPDGARDFPADPTVLFWLAASGWPRRVPANTCAVGFYRKCGFAKDEGEILVKELH